MQNTSCIHLNDVVNYSHIEEDIQRCPLPCRGSPPDPLFSLVQRFPCEIAHLVFKSSTLSIPQKERLTTYGTHSVYEIAPVVS